jgi:hypothetical protein
VAQRLVRRAARRLPHESQERYSEEWFAELGALPGKGLSKLVFAVRILWNAPGVRDALRGSLSRRTQLLLRLLDVSLAGMGLVVCVPLFAAIGAAMRTADWGPAVIRVRQIDLRGEVMSSRLAFRTFRMTRESNPAVGQTTIGRFLERSELMYLPSLIDVFRGRLSLVGPLASPDGYDIGVKPGLADWRLAFQRPDEIDLSAGHCRALCRKVTGSRIVEPSTQGLENR